MPISPEPMPYITSVVLFSNFNKTVVPAPSLGKSNVVENVIVEFLIFAPTDKSVEAFIDFCLSQMLS
ncbi:MAG: hypothetical protein ACLU5J_10150 [Christensenellales bacterium]